MKITNGILECEQIQSFLCPLGSEVAYLLSAQITPVIQTYQMILSKYMNQIFETYGHCRLLGLVKACIMSNSR